MAPSSPTSAKLPSYEEIRAEHELKSSFAHLLEEHEEIQRLFKGVAAQLEGTKQIGEGHELNAEWDTMFKKHRRLYRDSQMNAGQCASFLNNYSTVLIPLSKGNMTVQEKQMMINKFIETIPIHQETARRVATRFHELGKQVEVFPVKVSAYLRHEADKERGGFWWSLWNGIGDLCMSIWRGLQKLFTTIVNTFQSMLSRIDTIRFSCGPFIRIDVELSNTSRSQPTTTPRAALGQIKRDAKDLGDRLSGFEDAWHLARLACNNLLQDVEMAGQMAMGGVPAACDANLKAAEMVYAPLVHCLRAYSQGRSPL